MDIEGVRDRSAKPCPERSDADDRELVSRSVLGLRVDATSYVDTCERVARWSTTGESRYICVAPVHTVMEAFDSAEIRAVVNSADLVTPDGVPVVWALRLMGVEYATRVYGPDLTLALCERAANEGIPVGFYGGHPDTLNLTVKALHLRYPALRVAYQQSPPFRPLSEAEEADIARDINSSGARILFVGLGCPKQELWMARNYGQVRAVMLGVGAAFDFIAGTKRQAPRFLMALGLEWLFRLATEPRRLAWRYLYHNPRFVYYFSRQLLRRPQARSADALFTDND